ncbi:hypothetical protein [Streptomyces sp. NPDC001978]|uniref:hypothetical protein n=1 Tax=Streptomyces sp. NPDC001978 TaxID=3364627 RepID=UPI00368C9AFE
MVKGVLIGESLRIGAELVGVPLQVTRLWRTEVASATSGQPKQWTLMEFEAEEHEADRLAAAFAKCLAPTGGWYINYNTTDEAFVVFADHVVRYPRGDAAGRSRAQEHARSIGVPEPQLDWED